MGNLTLTTFGLIWVFLILISVGQIFIKRGIGDKSLAGGSIISTFMNILRAFARINTIIGFSLYVIGTFIWILVLSRVQLSVAYPMMSMSYILVVILSATVLHERVNFKLAGIGLLLISLGVSFIGFGMGQPGK